MRHEWDSESTDLNLAAHTDQSPPVFEFDISDVRVYDRVLTTREIVAISGMVSFWKHPLLWIRIQLVCFLEMSNKQKINKILYIAVMIAALVLGGGTVYLRAIHIDETSMRVFVMYWREYVIAVSVFTALLIAYNKTVE